MAFGIVIEIPGGTQAQYDAAVQKLEDAEAHAPSGRLFHAAGPMDGGWRVVDVWDSAESFRVFVETLIPITHAAGMPPFEPKPWPVHNVIFGDGLPQDV